MEAQELALIQCENKGLEIGAEGTQSDSHEIKEQLKVLKANIDTIRIQTRKATEEYTRVMEERQQFENNLGDGLSWLQSSNDEGPKVTTVPINAASLDGEIEQFYTKKQQIIARLQNTQLEIDQQIEHFRNLGEDIPPELQERIKMFEEIKASLMVRIVLYFINYKFYSHKQIFITN